jgi:hypothetical protein
MAFIALPKRPQNQQADQHNAAASGNQWVIASPPAYHPLKEAFKLCRGRLPKWGDSDACYAAVWVGDCQGWNQSMSFVWHAHPSTSVRHN